MQLPLGKGSSTKDAIVQILSEEWPLSVKQIYERVQKKVDKAITYQAVHKVVQELEKEKIVEKEGTGCKLNKGWIDKIKQFGENLSTDYASASRGSNSTEFVHLSFDCFLEAGKFVLNNLFFDFPNPEKKAAVCFSYHIYPPFGFSSREHENYKKIIQMCEHWALSSRDTYFDRWCSSYLKGIGKTCISGVKFSAREETYLNGDYVCQMFFPPELTTELDKLYENVKAIEDIEVATYFDQILCAKYKIDVIIFKDPKLAELFRQEFYKIKKEKGM